MSDNSFLAHRRSDDGGAVNLQQSLAEEDNNTLRPRTTPKSRPVPDNAVTESN